MKKLLAAALVLATSALAGPASPALAKDPDLGSLKKALGRALQADDERAIAEVLMNMANLDDPKAAPFLLDFTIKAEKRSIHDIGRDALRSVASQAGIATLAKALAEPKKGSPFEPRVLVAEALKELDGDGVAAALVAALKDEHKTVRRLAAEALARKKKEKAAVDALVEAYAAAEGEKGRYFMAVRRALVDLTGQVFATGAEWKEWWASKRESYDFDRDRGKSDETGITVVVRPKFFEQDVESTTVILILDISGSMEMWDPNAEHPKEKYENQRPPKERVRIERTKVELKKTIEGLGADVRFNIIAFSDGLRRFQSGLVAADAKGKADAIAYVENLRAQGGTHTDLALKDAFKDPDVDAIYMMSDGAPMKYGEDKADAKYRGETLTWAEKANRYRRVAIHTIGFDGYGEWPKHLGPRPQSLKEDKTKEFISFMKDLAAQNGGTYRSIP